MLLFSWVPKPMFNDRDLLQRLLSVALPPAGGYRRARATAQRGRDAIAATVRSEVERLLGDSDLAERAGREFLPAIACDDLDALTAALWPASLRRRSFRIEGGENLPGAGPVVLASFHMSGGFRVFDALTMRGLRPSFLRAAFDGHGSKYLRAIERARAIHFRRVLGDRLVEIGPGARDRLREQLVEGVAIVALLDVAPAQLGLQDTERVCLFGRELRLPAGLMRLAVETNATVVPYDGRIEEGRRVLRFQPGLAGGAAQDLLQHAIGALETTIRERPWDWQGWLDVEALLGKARQ